VHIAAILTLADGRSTDGDVRRARKSSFGGTAWALRDLLGRNLLDRTIDKLCRFGAMGPTVIREASGATQLLPSRSAKPSDFISAWEDAVGKYVQQGADYLMLLRLGSYSDLDFSELFSFHVERQSSLTQVYGPNGSLDIAIVNAAPLREANGAYRKALSALIPQQERFFYEGYINRLRNAQDAYQLIEDGLNSRCAIIPAGTEVGPAVWHGVGAQVDGSVEISGPVFVGAGSRVAASCRLEGATSIERDCEVDYGTLVNRSCILQGSYLGVGLDLRRSVVDNDKLFHLDRNIELGISDRRLIRASRPVSFFAGAMQSLRSGFQRAD
jgi:hypothetical protein